MARRHQRTITGQVPIDDLWRGDEPGAATQRGKKRLLLVDDEAAILESLQSMLEDAYCVSVASNGAEALRLAEAGLTFDLIVLDLAMPVLDGAGLVRALRERGIHTPVLIASADWDVRARARQLEVADWISKPFDIDQLEAKLERMTGQRARLAG